MKKLILLSILIIVGCDNSTEPVEDCAGVAGGTAVEDECGVCDGIDGYVAGSCYDCADTPNGNAVYDECDICGGDGIAEGACDCDGNVLDCSGVCGGDGIDSDDDNICDNIDECIGAYDACNVCNGPGKNYICDGSSWYVCDETECPEPYTCSCDNWYQQSVCSTGPEDGYNACGPNKNAICIENYPNCSECYCE